MKCIKTVQVQIVTHQDEITATLHAFRDAANFTSRYIHEHHVYNHKTVQYDIYHDIRDRFGLRSQMTCNCIKQAAAKYIVRKTRDRREPVLFKRPFMVLDYPRDYRIVDEHTVSVNTLGGRVLATFQCGQYQREMLRLDGWNIKSSYLFIRKKDKKLFLAIAIEKDVPEPMMIGRDGVVGVDVGMINVAVASGIDGRATFFGGGKTRYTRWKYQTIRQEGQSKDTRSARRRLRLLSGRERRFVTAENHRIAKEIVELSMQKYHNPVIAMENLKGIRKNGNRRKKQKAALNSWAFYQLRQFVTYKAAERGIPVVLVNPRYTSQRCPRCGHVHPGNRDRKNHAFTCRSCEYRSNDDRIGAMNIAMKAVTPGYTSGARGAVSTTPNAARDDPEALRGIDGDRSRKPRALARGS